MLSNAVSNLTGKAHSRLHHHMKHYDKDTGCIHDTWWTLNSAFLPVWRATTWRGPGRCTDHWSGNDTHRTRSGTDRRTCNKKTNHSFIASHVINDTVPTSKAIMNPLINHSSEAEEMLPDPSTRLVQTNITEKEINDTVRNKLNRSTNNLQRLYKNVTVATNIYVMIELLEASSSVRSVS